MDMFDIVAMPSIVVLVYWIINLLKTATNGNENFKKWIPVIANFLGMAFGVIIYFAFPTLAIAENLLFAIITGGASGLAATGTNQIFKQLLPKSAKPETEDKPKN